MHLKSHIHIFQELQLNLNQMPALNVANDLSQEPTTQARLHQKKEASLQQKPLNISSSLTQHKKA